MTSSRFLEIPPCSTAVLSIHGARFDAENGIATELQVSIPRVHSLVDPFIVNREQVIGTIEEGYFCLVDGTVTSKKKWTSRRVHLVEVDGQKYLRIDQEKIAEDFFGDIRGI